jgi:hypothetical protein
MDEEEISKLKAELDGISLQLERNTNQLANVSLQLAEKIRILSCYDAVLNALPKHQLVLASNAICAAYNGANHEALVEMLTEDKQEAKKQWLQQGHFFALNAYELHVIPPDKPGYIIRIPEKT